MSLVMAAAAVAAPPPIYVLALADIFLLFFIMIGPIKALAAYATAAHGMEPRQWTATAWKVFGVALVTTLVAGGVGGIMLNKWHIAPAVLQLAGGLVFLLVALQMVLAQYATPAPPGGTAAPPTPAGRLAFPVTIPAYGIAALIVLVALSGSADRYLWIMGLAILVLVLDLVTMLFIRSIMKTVGQLPLQILSAVLGMLQVALALQLITGAIRTIIHT